MEYLPHPGPALTTGGGTEGLLAWICQLPPALGFRVFRHGLHTSFKIVADILKVGEKVLISEENRVVLYAAACDLFQHRWPDGPVEAEVLFLMIGPKPSY